MNIPIISDLIKTASEGLSSLFTSDDERNKAKNILAKLTGDVDLEMGKLQAQIMLTDASGNSLQRSWRPILMLGFGFVLMLILLLNFFVFPICDLFNVFVPTVQMPVEIWSILQWIMSATILGRTSEKIMTAFKKNN